MHRLSVLSVIRETLEAYVNTEGELRVRAIKKGQADGDTSADNHEDAKGDQPIKHNTLGA